MKKKILFFMVLFLISLAVQSLGATDKKPLIVLVWAPPYNTGSCGKL